MPSKFIKSLWCCSVPHSSKKLKNDMNGPLSMLRSVESCDCPCEKCLHGMCMLEYGSPAKYQNGITRMSIANEERSDSGSNECNIGNITNNNNYTEGSFRF